MDRKEYETQLRAVLHLVGLVRGLKLSELIEAMNRAETVGPIVDPTLFMRASRSMEWQKQVVQSARTFQQAVEAIAQGYDDAPRVFEE